MSLAVLLDAWSRRGVGWALDRCLEAELALVAALRIALAKRQVPPGLVHDADRGAQYASRASTTLHNACAIQLSRGWRGNPYDHAHAERCIRLLQYEAVSLFEYQDCSEAYTRLSHGLVAGYHHKRLHSA